MAKYKPKNRISVHAKQRMNQRYQGNEDKEILARQAFHYGVLPCQVKEESDLRIFLESKECATGKRVRVLKGYVFLFSKSGRMITMYPIPDELKAEAESIKAVEDENRARWKRWKEGMNSSHQRRRGV